MKVLIAEDDRISSTILRKTLEKQGYEVTALNNGREAWETYENGDFRLVISDWMMPEMDGLELCRRIRSRNQDSYTYIIFLTAKTQREDKLAGLHNGADDYLTKPLDSCELLARLCIAQRIISMQEELRQRSLQMAKKQEQLTEANRKLSELSITDGLTGLKNHRHIREELDSAYSFSIRHRMPFSLIMLDVDCFKQFNDEFGHPAGDEVLRTLAGILQKLLRDHDIVGRYGGEEFAVILPATDQQGCLQVAERLRVGVSNYEWPKKKITISVGVSTFGIGDSSAAMLLEQADQALYRSKRNGRNLVTCFLERGLVPRR